MLFHLMLQAIVTSDDSEDQEALSGLATSFSIVENVLDKLEEVPQFDFRSTPAPCNTIITPELEKNITAALVAWASSGELTGEAEEFPPRCEANIARYGCEILSNDYIMEEEFGSGLDGKDDAGECVETIANAIVDIAQNHLGIGQQLMDCVPSDLSQDPEVTLNEAETCFNGIIITTNTVIEHFKCFKDHPGLAKVMDVCFDPADVDTFKDIFEVLNTVVSGLVEIVKKMPAGDQKNRLSVATTSLQATVSEESKAVLASLGAADLVGYAATIAMCAIASVVAVGFN